MFVKICRKYTDSLGFLVFAWCKFGVCLQTYRRSLDPASALDMTIPLDILKMEVTAAVEHEVNQPICSQDIGVQIKLLVAQI